MRSFKSLFLCFCGAILFCVPSFAQSSSSLVLDAASLTPVNVDAVTGLALDPIVKDRSNRPCARIKLHVNRMTPEEISELEVKAPGGNVLVMKQQVAQEGNGLIIELTARPETRIYLHHDKYGDSNPVTLVLEGNKEYRMEAWNETRLSIAVSFADAGSEVYLDDSFRGYIDDNNHLTIADVTLGNHDLSLRYSGGEYKTQIYVSPSDILFYFDPSLPRESAESESININVDEQSVKGVVSRLVERESAEGEIYRGNQEIESFGEQVKEKSPVEGSTMIMAYAGVFPCMSYGVMVGHVKKIGAYAKFRSNFSFIQTAYGCTSDGLTEYGELMYTSGLDARYSLYQATGGLMLRLAKSIYPYVGSGYGSFGIQWQDYIGNWADVMDYSFKGISAEAGLIIRLGRLNLSVGVSTIAFKYTDVELGLGFMF